MKKEEKEKWNEEEVPGRGQRGNRSMSKKEQLHEEIVYQTIQIQSHQVKTKPKIKLLSLPTRHPHANREPTIYLGEGKSTRKVCINESEKMY